MRAIVVSLGSCVTGYCEETVSFSRLELCWEVVEEVCGGTGVSLGGM